MTTDTNQVDWELLSRAYAGDDAATDQLFNKFYRRLIIDALRIMGGDSDAEDAAQMALIALFKSRIQKREQTDTVSAWLHRVCRNKCRDMLRKKKRVQSTERDDEDGDDYDYFGAGIQSELRDEFRAIVSTANDHEVVERAHDLEIALEGLSELTNKERLVIHLRYFQEPSLSNAEIAAFLGVSEARASNIHAQAARKLRRRLELEPNVDTRDEHIPQTRGTGPNARQP